MRLSRRLARALTGFSLALTSAVAGLTWPAPVHAAAYASAQEIEADFQKGLRALEAGDAETAIRLFRAILAQRPALPRVRLELARAYFAAREWERSRRAFFAVLSGDIPDTVRTNVIRYLRAIDARRGFDWDLSVALAASPRAARSYDTDTVMVEVGGVRLPFTIEREDDGAVGIEASGEAEYRFDLSGPSTEGVRVTALAGASFDVFEGEGRGADDYTIGGELGVRGAWPRTSLTGSTFVSTREFAGDHFEDRLGVATDLAWRDRSGISFFSSVTVGVVDDHVAEARDGTFGRLRAGVAKSIAGRASAGAALFGEHLDAERDFETYTTLGGQVFGSADIGLGLDVSGQIYLLNQEYRAPVPGLAGPRNEWEYGVDLDVAKTDLFLLGQFTPFVRLGVSRRKSSLDAFSYYEHRLSLGVRRAF